MFPERIESTDQLDDLLSTPTAGVIETSGKPADTWAVNCWLPANICQRYAASRIAAFSTGNVYPLTTITSGGSVESDPLAPVGEYAASCVGRERMFEYFSRTAGTAVSIL